MKRKLVLVGVLLIGVLLVGLVIGAGYNIVVPPATPAVDSPSSGPGGGAMASADGKIYYFSYDVAAGKLVLTKIVKIADKINFEIPSGGSGGDVVLKNHTVTVNKISATHVELTVQSDPIKLNLSIGESKKLSLEMAGYYDTLIKLEGVNNLQANLTMLSIYEEIPASEGDDSDTDATTGSGEDTDVLGVTSHNKKFWIWFLVIAVVLIAAVIGAVHMMKKKK